MMWIRPSNASTSAASEKRLPRVAVGPKQIEKKLHWVGPVRSGKRKARWDSGPSSNSANFGKSGAGEGIRTLDPDLGKVVLYH